MWSRMGLTVSVLETTGIVSAVCGESLAETQPSHVPPSECVLAPLESGPCQTSDTQVLFCSLQLWH